MKLTRLLYEYNDVKHSLVISLLEGKDFNEVLFWTIELIESGYLKDLWSLLMKFYLDFCNINQYMYMVNINNQYKKSIDIKQAFNKKYELKCIINVLNHLFNIEKNDIVFKLRNKDTNVRILYKKIDNIENFNNKQNQLYHSIKRKNINNICYYFNKLELNDILAVYEKYFNKKQNLNSFYKDKKHILLSKFCKKLYNRKISYKKINHFTEENLNKYLKIHNIPRKILLNNRYYAVKDNIGCFKSNRSDNFVNDFRYNWLYYAKQSDIWKMRLISYGRIKEWKKIDDEFTHSPVFKNEDLQEKFFEHYGLEPDEQSLEVQLKSTKKIENKNINIVFKKLNISSIKCNINKTKKIDY